jgi:hypothetical protein
MATPSKKFHVIKKQVSASDKIKNGKPYTLYTYLVEDHAGNEDLITSLQKFDIEDKCRAWFSKFNSPGIGLLCQKCLKPIKNDSERVYHEFCNISHAGTDI